MGEKKVTIMVLKVDLQCHKCYKKVKKVLCKFPQIRDQIYDEKQNQVVIKVLCCNPEKIRDKICCKGGSAIKSIEIVKEPEKPPPAGKPKDDGKPKGDGKPKDDGKPKGDSKPKDDGKPKGDGKPKDDGKPKGDGKPKDDAKPKDDSKPKDDGKSKAGPPNPGPPPPQPSPCVPGYGLPVRACCMDCYQGHAGGPCYSGYGGGPAPYIQYDGYYGRPVYDSYGGGSKGYCEENPSSCIVM